MADKMKMRTFGLVVLTLWAARLVGGSDFPTFHGTTARTGGTDELVPPKSSGAVLTLRWTTSIASHAQIGSPIVGGGRVYAASKSGTVYCLHPDDGSVLWTFATSGALLSTPVYFQGRVYVTGTDGYIYVLHGLTGAHVLSPILHGTGMAASPLVVSGISIGGTAKSRDQIIGEE